MAAESVGKRRVTTSPLFHILAKFSAQSNGVQMQVRVELPPGELIDCEDFALAIARAKRPVIKDGARGMACVVGKLVLVCDRSPESAAAAPQESAATAPQEVRPSASKSLAWSHLEDTGGDGNMFDLTDGQCEQLKLLDPFSVSAQRAEGVSFALTESDCQLLEELLPKLPELVMPVSESDRPKFVEDFRTLAGDVDWVPDVMTEQIAVRQRQLQGEYFERTIAVLAEKVARGQLMACDESHTPITRLGRGSQISRSTAIAYLEQCGFAYGDGASNEDQRRKAQPSEPEPAQALANIPSPEQSEEASAREANRASPLVSDVESLRKGKVIRIEDVEKLTSIKRSSIYNRMNSRSKYYDQTFPKSFLLGGEPSNVAVWYEAEVSAWIARQAAAGRTGAAKLKR